MKTDFFISDENGIRLDKFISKQYKKYSRSKIQKLIEEKNVYVNGKVEKKNYTLTKGDKIKINFPEEKKLQLKAENIDIDIIYEDEYLAVINKQRGLVVHPAHGNRKGTLVNGLLNTFENLSSIDGHFRPGIVHRLDKDTTGLLLVAKNNFAHINLSQEIKKHKLKREYTALVHGALENNRGKIITKIGRNKTNRKKMAVLSRGRNAITHFEIIKKYKKYSYLKLNLETGRTHQIRVHMAYINHPLVGDTTYGPKNNEFNIDGQLLHAKTIGFTHPKTKEYLSFSIEEPEDFLKILEILEGRNK